MLIWRKSEGHPMRPGINWDFQRIPRFNSWYLLLGIKIGPYNFYFRYRAWAPNYCSYWKDES